MTDHTENVWCPICGETMTVTADVDVHPAVTNVVVDAQLASHICEIKGSGPKGLIATLREGKPE